MSACLNDGRKHGTEYGYNRGCRGDACREAKAARDARDAGKYREKRRGASVARRGSDPRYAAHRADPTPTECVPDGLTHGTAGGYGRGCRGPACREAKREADARQRARPGVAAAIQERRATDEYRERARTQRQARQTPETAERRRSRERAKFEDPVARARRNAQQRARYATSEGRARRRVQQAAYAERLKVRTDEELAAVGSSRWPGGTKPCRSCHRDLPLSAFYTNRSRPDGLSVACRPCECQRLYRRVAAPRWVSLGLKSCVYCGDPWEHVDHAHPRALGGTDDPENLVPACAPCNLRKSDTPLLEWLDRIGQPSDLFPLAYAERTTS